MTHSSSDKAKANIAMLLEQIPEEGLARSLVVAYEHAEGGDVVEALLGVLRARHKEIREDLKDG